jgi:hypothetical protein
MTFGWRVVRSRSKYPLERLEAQEMQATGGKTKAGPQPEGLQASSRGRSVSADHRIAAHAGAATDGAFFDWAGLGTIERLKRMSRLHVLAVSIVQKIKNVSASG